MNGFTREHAQKLLDHYEKRLIELSSEPDYLGPRDTYYIAMLVGYLRSNMMILDAVDEVRRLATEQAAPVDSKGLN